MQLLAKFKKILYMGFRAILNFRKFKVALKSTSKSMFKSTSWKVLETVLSHLNMINMPTCQQANMSTCVNMFNMSVC